MIKSLRGLILDFLNRIYPREIEELEIIAVFYQYYRDTEIRQALAYLADKGYVDVKKVVIPYDKRRYRTLYKITPKGIDLLDGEIVDDTVLPPEDA
jgi:DNA-binding PadR family transcriptional regulator